jgi:hypothetical protein
VCQNPALVEALAQDRLAELRRGAQARSVALQGARTRSILAASRRATGWLLIDVGLRLAVPRAAIGHPQSRGSA